tara:strand:- start:5424 stop:6317 length:894 start_codon:yes stop_codon:yes gene_type:complete
MKFLVTGGRGFIGSHFVELALKEGHKVIDFDCLTYASSKQLPWDNNPNYSFEKVDIRNISHLPPCDIIVNFAAESHVDNSIISSRQFFETNTFGVYNILELLRGKVYNRPLFLHISTDEVYGDIRQKSFTESDKLNPGNPYAASKAAAEMFVLSHNKTYGIDYIITRSSNNYGKRQYVEKLIPQIIYCLENNKKIPIHGDGTYVRDWLRVEDNARAIYHLALHGTKNEVYNISADNHLSNLEVVRQICEWYDIDNHLSCIDFVPNRLGQDIRYSIDSSKLASTGFHLPKGSGIQRYK